MRPFVYLVCLIISDFYYVIRCVPCGLVVESMSNFRRHHRRTHVPPFECAYCGNHLEHFTSFIRHLKTSHPNGENVPNAQNVVAPLVEVMDDGRVEDDDMEEIGVGG